MISPPEISPTELAVLELLAEGCHTSEIAKRLSLQYRSVAVIISTIKSKLNLQSPGEIREFVQHQKSVRWPRKN